MATLTNTKIKDTYDGLLKTTNNEAIAASGVTLIEDGLGNASALSVGRSGNGVTITGSLNATLATAAQPNITSVGTLSSLAVTGNLTVDTNTLYVDALNNRVGIGISSGLSAALHVNGETYFNQGLYIQNYDDQANRWVLYTNVDDSFRFNYNGAGNDEIVIDSSGNVGIGTSSPDSLLHLKGSTSKITLEDSDVAGATCIIQGGGAGNLTIAADPNNAVASSYITLQVDAAERMRIDSSGNVGIGTSDGKKSIFIDKALTIVSGGSGTQSAIELSGNNTSNNFISGVTFHNEQSTDTTNGKRIAQIYTERDGANNAGALVFGTHDSSTTLAERMRITSGGDVLIGSVESNSSVSTSTGLKLFNSNSSTAGRIDFRKTYSGATNVTANYHAGTYVGGIVASNTATSFDTASDYRLKEDLQPIANPLDRVDSLNPINFAWKADGSRVDGFLAHEVQDIVPEAVTGEKDAVDEEGNPVYQGIDQSKIVPLLVGAIQELRAEIESLKSQLNA